MLAGSRVCSSHDPSRASFCKLASSLVHGYLNLRRLTPIACSYDMMLRLSFLCIPLSSRILLPQLSKCWCSSGKPARSAASLVSLLHTGLPALVISSFSYLTPREQALCPLRCLNRLHQGLHQLQVGSWISSQQLSLAPLQFTEMPQGSVLISWLAKEAISQFIK